MCLQYISLLLKPIISTTIIEINLNVFFIYVFTVTRKSMELQQYMKKNDVNPLKSFAGILIQVRNENVIEICTTHLVQSNNVCKIFLLLPELKYACYDAV